MSWQGWPRLHTSLPHFVPFHHQNWPSPVWVHVFTKSSFRGGTGPVLETPGNVWKLGWGQKGVGSISGKWSRCWGAGSRACTMRETTGMRERCSLRVPGLRHVPMDVGSWERGPRAQALLWSWVTGSGALQCSLWAAEETQVIQGRVVPLQPPLRILPRLDATHCPGAPGAPLAPLAPGRPRPLQDMPVGADEAGTGGSHLIAQELFMGRLDPQRKAHQAPSVGAPLGFRPPAPSRWGREDSRC